MTKQSLDKKKYQSKFVYKLDPDDLIITGNKSSRKTVYTPIDKLRYVILNILGYPDVVSGKRLGVDWRAIDYWKNKSSWFPIHKAKMMKALTEADLEIDLTDILAKSLEELKDRLDNGDEVYDNRSGEKVRKKVAARDLQKIAVSIFDKRALVRGDPTSRVEHRSPDKQLADLRKKFEDWNTGDIIEGELVPSGLLKDET